MKFKVGEKVRVRENRNRYYSDGMEDFFDKICTISYVGEDDYILVEDDGKWCWADDMLEPVEEISPKQIIKNQVQQIKKENEKNCDNCKHYDTYFDCGQCEDFDEWQEKNNNHLKIILLSGKAQHGKDSAAKMLFEKLKSKGKKVLIAHYGDLVKYTCKTFFGWNGEKDEPGRTLLQEVGTDKVRVKYPNFWVDYIRDILSIFEDKWDYVLIPDTRFPNEVDVMKDTFNDVVSIRIVRTNFVSPLTEEQRNHRSETALDDYHFDYYFIADDLKQLERKVDIFLYDLEA